MMYDLCMFGNSIKTLCSLSSIKVLKLIFWYDTQKCSYYITQAKINIRLFIIFEIFMYAALKSIAVL